jgi:predicted  nucleic acid-binding Zn-ribbon protein
MSELTPNPNNTDNCYCWCTVCGSRFGKEAVQSWGCPKCGNEGVPCDPHKDVMVAINWHELRILVMWAENWANRSVEDKDGATKTVQAIAGRIQRQWPEINQPLTLSGEIGQLREKPNITKVESTVPELPAVHEFGPGAVGFTRPMKDAGV